MILNTKNTIVEFSAHFVRPSVGLIFALILCACGTTTPPYQTLYEAQTAINAAEQRLGPCPCEALTPAKTSYAKAKAFNQQAQYRKARFAANQALEQAQIVLRRER